MRIPYVHTFLQHDRVRIELLRVDLEHISRRSVTSKRTTASTDTYGRAEAHGSYCALNHQWLRSDLLLCCPCSHLREQTQPQW